MRSFLKNNLLGQYLIWHFCDVPRNILHAWRNFLLFNLDYFSIPLLIKTLFSPWRRYAQSYGKGLNIGRYFEAFVFNMMSRLIGAILRFFLILVGLLVEIFIFFIGAGILLIWLLLPLLLIGGLIFGFRLLI